MVSLPLIPSEPLLLLKSNLPRAMMQLKEDLSGPPSDNKGHIAFGKILGYAYVGEDWTNDPSYGISYNVGPLSLYSFNVPWKRYTSSVKAKILSDLEQYNEVLRLYGYEVYLSVMSCNDTECKMLSSLP